MLCIPGITLWSTISINLAIPYWAISIALNIIITACITARLLYMRYQMRKLIDGSGAEYLSITAMLTESAALYTSNGLIFLVTYAVNSPIQNLALPVLGQTQVRSFKHCCTGTKLTHFSVHCAPPDYLACPPRSCLVVVFTHKVRNYNSEEGRE
jgi:hypothetical protein